PRRHRRPVLERELPHPQPPRRPRARAQAGVGAASVRRRPSLTAQPFVAATPGVVGLAVGLRLPEASAATVLSGPSPELCAGAEPRVHRSLGLRAPRLESRDPGDDPMRMRTSLSTVLFTLSLASAAQAEGRYRFTTLRLRGRGE